MNRADWPSGSIFQRDNPDWIAAIVRPQRVAHECERDVRCFRGVARHRVSAGRIQVEPHGVDCGAFDGTNDRTIRVALGNDLVAFDGDFAHAIWRAPVRHENFPGARLRIAVDARHGNDLGDQVAIQLRADDAQGFIRAGIFLGESWRGKEEQGRQQFPHGERELCLRRMSTEFSVLRLNGLRHMFSLHFV